MNGAGRTFDADIAYGVQTEHLSQLLGAFEAEHTAQGLRDGVLSASGGETGSPHAHTAVVVAVTQ